MQFIIDNLIAIIVTTTITMSLLTQQTATQQNTLERQAIYGAKVQALGFGEWVEDDIVRLGARFGASRDRFSYENVQRNGVAATNWFEYFYNERTNADGSVLRVEVRYEVVPTDSLLATRPGDPGPVYVQLYRLDRTERMGAADGVTGAWLFGSGPSWTPSVGYGSPAGLAHFYVQPLDSEGRTDVEPSEADYVRMQFSVVPTLFPLHRARIIPRTGLQWATTIEIRPF